MISNSYMQKKIVVSLSLLLLIVLKTNAQTAIVYGVVRDSLNKPVESVNVSMQGETGGVISDSKGKFEFTVPANKEITIAFSFLGYRVEKKTLKLASGERREINTKIVESVESPII